MLTIKDFNDYFLREQNPKFFINDVFSWRGRYADVAFVISSNGSRNESLDMIYRALTEPFSGYKGGTFEFNLDTEVHFERSEDGCSNIDIEKYLKLNYDCDIKSI